MTDFKFSNKVRVRACAVIVKNSSILLTKINSPTRKEPIWMPPGGGVEFGETVEEALLREVKEETGVQIKKHQLLWIHEFIEEPYHAIEFYFRCEVIGGDLVKGTDPELQSNQQMLIDLDFIPLKESNELDIEPKFIKEFCKAGGEFFENVRHVVSRKFSH
ncbi:MAG: NUDIX domain-containing protein [Balneolaceae bacterium]|nr:NUDIX domain-containing protein [Balneolaceae bacterium]